MTRTEAVADAVKRVKEGATTLSVVRRGDEYRVEPMYMGTKRGWKVAEMIGPGNVQNYAEQ